VNGIFLGGSLAAAFLAGSVALFAPCCITVLFPTYLAAAVKNARWRLVPLTLVFAAGVATVLVPVGGGGLISGIAVAVKALCPAARIIGVEPTLAGDLAEGYASGVHVTWDHALTARTVADGLRVASVGELNWEHITALVDDVVTVDEEAILEAMARLATSARIVAEPSGAVTTAAYLTRPDIAAGPTVAVVSGGNVEPALLAEVLTSSGGDG
jgi:threonine dehydratase